MEEQVTLTYSGIVRIQGRQAVRVRFERGKKAFVEGIVPGAVIERSEGFSEEEIAQIQNYLQEQENFLLERAKELKKNMLFRL